jgi:hypothetical protein
MIKSLNVHNPDVPDSLVDLSDEMERIAYIIQVIPGYLRYETSRHKTPKTKINHLSIYYLIKREYQEFFYLLNYMVVSINTTLLSVMRYYNLLMMQWIAKI